MRAAARPRRPVSRRRRNPRLNAPAPHARADPRPRAAPTPAPGRRRAARCSSRVGLDCAPRGRRMSVSLSVHKRPGHAKPRVKRVLFYYRNQSRGQRVVARTEPARPSSRTLPIRLAPGPHHVYAHACYYKRAGSWGASPRQPVVRRLPRFAPRRAPSPRCASSSAAAALRLRRGTVRERERAHVLVDLGHLSGGLQLSGDLPLPARRRPQRGALDLRRVRGRPVVGDRARTRGRRGPRRPRGGARVPL